MTGTELRSHYGLTEGGQITLAGGGEDEGVGAPLEDVELRIGEEWRGRGAGGGRRDVRTASSATEPAA